MAYTPSAILFDGSTNSLATSAALTGAANSKLFTFSAWVRMDGGDAGASHVLAAGIGAGVSLQIIHKNDNSIQFFETSLNVFSSTNSLKVSTGWTHVCASFDMASGTFRHLYINDVEDLATTINYVDAELVIGATADNWHAGANQIGGSLLPGALADLWYTSGVTIDFSVAANRRKFISADGFPVYLGADGSTPTGTAPRVFLQGKDLTDRGVNSGSGGNFAENGTFTPTEGPGNFVVPAQILAKRSGRYHRLHR